MSRGDIDAFADVARALADEEGLEATLQRIVDLAVEIVPGADQAGITRVRRRKQVDTVAATKDLPATIDQVQYETGQGPCLDAIWEQETVKVDDLSATDRWPEFSPRAADLGVLSMVSFRLFVSGDVAGALNMYSGSRNAFGQESVGHGHVFAAHAALAWDHEREVTSLRAAVEARTVVGQAQGMLMALQKVSAEEAFELLREASQRSNIKLRELAEHVIESGGFPPGASAG